jgi:hypothetical protein
MCRMRQIIGFGYTNLILLVLWAPTRQILKLGLVMANVTMFKWWKHVWMLYYKQVQIYNLCGLKVGNYDWIP